jgi:thiamine-monophosphate kinase
VSEQQILDRIAKRLPFLRRSGLVLGPGDDCAIFRPKGSTAGWLITTDLVLENIHFRPDTHPASAVGHRVLARGLSDIAAMGGAPKFCLLSLALPPWAQGRWLDGFLRGFGKLARRFGVVLAGGDLARAPQLVCDIIACGEVPHGKALRRDGARPGDQICVSGQLGASACGLRTRTGEAWRRHLWPEPRLELGRYLRDKLGATAAMDLSDGLSLDLHRMALASGLAAHLDREPPRYPGATLEEAVHGGEDYELLFTIPAATRLPASYRGLPLTRIGVMQRGKPGEVLLNGAPLAPSGYDHFRAPLG